MPARNPSSGAGLIIHRSKLLGVEMPISVRVPNDLEELAHGGFGRCHSPPYHHRRPGEDLPRRRVGRLPDVHLPAAQSAFECIQVQDDVILGTGAKVLGKQGALRIGRGSVIGANAVLLQSTGEYEIWAGLPACCVGRREPPKSS